MVIAVGQPGSVLNAVGTGIAKLVTEKTPIEMRVRVTAGMDALVGAGDAEIGVSASDAAHISSNGLLHYEGRPQTGLRLALAGPPLVLGFIVRADSSFRTLSDLRGVRVPGEYPNTRPIHHDGNAMLATVGMTWSDLDVLPVASFRDGIQAFLEGRADAVISSVGSGMTQQADAALGGIRFLTLPEGEDVAETMWREEPGFHPVRVAAGSALGIEEDLVLAGKDTYVTAHTRVDSGVVYDLVTLLSENMGELESVHPLFSEWTRESMANARVTIPFHDGAVRFLRETGAWTAEHEETQKRLLANLSPE
jgi:TRAP transporter TAXI family solute receptor